MSIELAQPSMLMEMVGDKKLAMLAKNADEKLIRVSRKIVIDFNFHKILKLEAYLLKHFYSKAHRKIDYQRSILNSCGISFQLLVK